MATMTLTATTSVTPPTTTDSCDANHAHKRFPIVQALEIPPLPPQPKRNILTRLVEKCQIEVAPFALEPWESAILNTIAIICVWFSLAWAYYSVQRVLQLVW